MNNQKLRIVNFSKDYYSSSFYQKLRIVNDIAAWDLALQGQNDCVFH